jgi:hypothetical protein
VQEPALTQLFEKLLPPSGDMANELQHTSVPLQLIASHVVAKPPVQSLWVATQVFVGPPPPSAPTPPPNMVQHRGVGEAHVSVWPQATPAPPPELLLELEPELDPEPELLLELPLLELPEAPESAPPSPVSLLVEEPHAAAIAMTPTIDDPRTN